MKQEKPILEMNKVKTYILTPEELEHYRKLQVPKKQGGDHTIGKQYRGIGS